MSAVVDALLAELTDEDLRALAERLRPHLSVEPSEPAAWLNAEDAARHLGCSRDRIYDLVQLGRLQPRRDGRRLLFKRAELDGYLEQA